jgi:hypothetical protein
MHYKNIIEYINTKFLNKNSFQLQALNKKEHKNGTCSPDSPEPDTDYQLTPRTEAKYSKIDEEFQLMMQRNQQLNGSRVSYKNAGIEATILTGYELITSGGDESK